MDAEESSEDLERLKQHRVHPAFVELQHLMYTPTGYEWKEKARWIKLEEDVEHGSDRWSTPFIPSLSYRAINDLRYCLQNGIVSFDVELQSRKQVSNYITQRLQEKACLLERDAGELSSILLARNLHHHEKEKKRSQHGLGKNTNKINTEDFDSSADVEQNAETSSKRCSSEISKKISPNSEAAIVFVAQLSYIKRGTAVFMRLVPTNKLKSMTEVDIPVRFICFITGPADDRINYYEVGRSVGTLLSDQTFARIAYHSQICDDVISGIDQFLCDSIVLPPGEWDKHSLKQSVPKLETQTKKKKSMRRETVVLTNDERDRLMRLGMNESEDPLEKSGRFCGNLINDLIRKKPHFISDFTGAFNLRCLVAIIFVYFASLAPAVTFGALLSDHTYGWLGVSEMIIATGVCGILFGVLAGQPLIIIGATGPLLVMEESVYDLAQLLKVDFLAWRAWIGIWVAVICIFMAMFDLCYLVKYFTRFTEEIFAALVSIIFIAQPLMYLAASFKENPMESFTNTTLSQSMNTNQNPNKSLMNFILLFSTFALAFSLRKFRHSSFFPIGARRLLSDFGVLIAITIVVLFDVLIGDTFTAKLVVPDGFQPTSPHLRDWLVPLFGTEKNISIWDIIISFFPAALLSFLVFMEILLTGVILDKKENKLKKGSGYHLDLFVVGLLIGICGVFGLPWMCASPVHSVSHLNALQIFSTTHAPGTKPFIVDVKEQRVTNIIMHLLIAMSVLLAPALRYIPIAILFGVFLYLGVTSLSHLQFIQRVTLLFIPSRNHPDTSCIRQVKTNKIHWFTIVQLICLISLVIIKSTVIAPAFPLFVLALIPLRNALKRFYSDEELEQLDNENEDVDGSDFDEYDTIHVPI